MENGHWTDLTMKRIGLFVFGYPVLEYKGEDYFGDECYRQTIDCCAAHLNKIIVVARRRKVAKIPEGRSRLSDVNAIFGLELPDFGAGGLTGWIQAAKAMVSPGLMRSLIDLCGRADFIYVDSSSVDAYFAARAARRAKKKIMVEMRGDVLLNRDYMFTRFGLAGIGYSWFIRLAFSFVRRQAFAGLYINASLMRRYPVRGGHIAAIPDARIPPELYSKPKPLASPAANFLYVGHLEKVKRVDLIIRALAEASQRLPDSWNLTIVGDGPEESSLKRLAKGLDIENRINFKGRIKWGNPLFRIYREAHLLLVTSLTESGPRVIIEAMASGLPILSTPVGLAEDLLDRRMIVNSQDASIWARAISAVANDPDTLNDMAEKNSRLSRDFEFEVLDSRRRSFYEHAIIPDSRNLKNNLKGIKICCVSHVPFHLVSHLKAQVEYLRDIGMDVVLVSSAGPELSRIKLGAGLSHEIVEIPRLLKPWKDLMALIRLINIFSKHKFDIVHSTTPKAGLLSSIAAFLARVPVRLHTWTGQQWVTLHGPLRWFCRSADKVIGILNTRCYADSESQRRFLVSEKIVAHDKIGVIGHGSLAGVDLKRFDPGRWSPAEKQRLKQELSISSDSRVIVFIGRITRDKGVLELIAAFNKLLNLKYAADLLLIGPFDQECGGVSSINLTDKDKCKNIHYLGYAESPERYLSIADIFCLPSYREGFGTTVIEAAAMGIPAVGTRINGLVDAVADNETGILIPSHNDEALMGAIKKLLDDPDLLHKMGKAARHRCIQLFDADLVNKNLAKEYVRLLCGPQ